MSIRDEFITAVCNCADLPDSVHNAASTVDGLEESTFVSTYLNFLDEQIELNARGDEWSDRLRRRRVGLAEWCDRPLIHGSVVVGPNEYTVRVDRESHSVVFWEEYVDTN